MQNRKSPDFLFLQKLAKYFFLVLTQFWKKALNFVFPRNFSYCCSYLLELLKNVWPWSYLTEGLAESVVGAEGAPRAFILKLGYFGLILWMFEGTGVKKWPMLTGGVKSRLKVAKMGVSRNPRENGISWNFFAKFSKISYF